MPFERSAALRRQLDDGLAAMAALAPLGYTISLHYRRGRPMARFTTFNEQWLDHYIEHGFFLRDPLLGWASSENGVIRWSDARIRDPYDLLGEARGFGFHYGAVASVGPPSSMTVGKIVRADREFTDQELDTLSALVLGLHELIPPPGKLTAPQVEALRIIAEGRRYAGAAAQLGISESALKARLYSARERLRARTTPEAIRRAKDFGLL